MENEAGLEVYRQYQNHQAKYVYFLLAAAAACVALCVKRTTGMTLDLPMILVGLALACWSFSFWAGCRMLRAFGESLFLNLELIKVQSGIHPVAGTDPESQGIGREHLKESMEQQSNKGVFWYKAQSRSLFLGAGLFIAWHIVNMALTAQPVTGAGPIATWY